MRITMLNQKGGVGKSTVSILVGAALQLAGYRVAFDDRDPQGSVRLWAKDIGKLPLVEDGGENDVIICDTPGRLDLAHESAQGFLRPLIAESDRIILVCEKSLFSIHATVPMVELVKSCKREEAKAAILFNKVRAGTAVGKQSPVDLATGLGLPALENSLPLAATFENVQIAGFGSVTGKHREQILTLALEILK